MAMRSIEGVRAMIGVVDEQAPPSSERPPGAPRRSKCMEAAKARERERIMAMTPLERIELAWELGQDLEALRAAQQAEE